MVAVNINIFSSDFWFSFGMVFDWFTAIGFVVDNWMVSNYFYFVSIVMHWSMMTHCFMMYWGMMMDWSMMTHCFMMDWSMMTLSFMMYWSMMTHCFMMY